jgi:hypothetical protein
MLPPNKLKITGNILIFVSKNSASNNKTFSGNTKIEFPQKSVPNPTIISFKTYPIKILQIDKKNKGPVIFKLGSCTCETINLFIKGFFKKVNDNTRIE